MIDSIKLFNFQCHANLTLDCDRITTLVGPSDSGKSAILRAIDWVLFNHGTASTYLKRGTKTVAAQIIIDGNSIVRSSKNNSYKFNDLEYHAVGKAIPEDIAEFLKVSEDNIQRQHNSLYWFTESGSAIMANLNRIVDLSKLDEWTHTAQSKIRQQTQKEAVLTETISNQEKMIESLQDVPAFDQQLTDIETRYTNLNALNKRYNQIKAMRDGIAGLTEQVRTMRQYVQAIQSLVESMSRIIQHKQKADKIRTTLHTLSGIQKQLTLRTELSTLLTNVQTNQQLSNKQLLLSGLMQKIKQCSVQHQPLCVFIQSLQSLLKQHEALSTLQTKQTLINKVLSFHYPPSPLSLQTTLATLQQQQSKYKQLKRDLQAWCTCTKNVKTKQQTYTTLQTDFTTQLDGHCPICGQVYCGEHT